MEILPMRNIVTQCRDHLNVIDTILEQVQLTFHKLNDKRDRIASSMRRHEGFISCIRRLPSDVLSHIFMQCLPNSTYLTPHIRDAPLLLTQICRGWRAVALGTPRLWCSLSIAYTSRDPKRLLSLYKHWLANSGRCPLSLEISLSTRCFGNFWQWSPMATEFSRLYTSRCTTLNIDCTDDRVDLLLADVPNLERLYLVGLNTMSQKISIVQPRPRLHTLVIISTPFTAETLSFFNPGWTNLTRLAVSFDDNPRLRVGPANNAIFLTLLQTCPNLEIFVFSPVFIQGSDNPVTLTHSKLRTLGIRHQTDSILSPLDTLIFPNLRRLLVDSTRDVEDVLNDISTPEESLPDGRRSLNMTFVKLHGQSSTHALFTVFNPGWPGLTHFCPQLEDMTVSILTVIDDHHYTLPAHHTLSSLTLGVERGSIGMFLDALTLPSLHYLNLSMDSGWPHLSFKAFFSRSSCPLETLKIRGAKASKVGREKFTSLIPTLKELDLHDKSERL